MLGSGLPTSSKGGLVLSLPTSGILSLNLPSGFSDSCVLEIFYLVPPAMIGFFLCELGFIDSCIVGTFYLMPPTVTIFFFI